MNIVVLACASRVSGALTIYKQFLTYLPDYTDGNRYYIFVDPSMPQPEIEGVTYIHEADHSWKRRIWLNNKGITNWLSDNDVHADVIVSLQNTGIKTDCRQLIYYHQSIPFYPQKWNPFKKKELTLFLYKYLYPLFVKKTLNKNTDVVVQIPFIQKGLVKRVGLEDERVHVLFPDVEKINADKVLPYPFQNGTYNIVYPSIPEPYKQHKTLVKAVFEVKMRNPELGNRLRLHFTFKESDYPALSEDVNKNGLSEQVDFMGRVPHDELLKMYKSSTFFCFPSTIETIGLPLLEAAAFGLPILAADVEYAREVLDDYDGVTFLPPTEPSQWANAIEKLCDKEHRFTTLTPKPSSWPKFFELMLNGRNTQIPD